MMRFSILSTVTALVAFAMAPTHLLAQPFPNKPVELVVPFSPGGATDAMARIVAPRLSTELGVPVIVTNKPGANSAIGTNYVLASQDGYRIGTGGNSNLGTILIGGSSPGYSLDDVAGLGRAVSIPMVLVTQKDRFRNLNDFVTAARKSPGGLQVASWGHKSPGHFATAMLSQQSGMKLQHIPFEGGAKAVVAAIGGHVDAALVTIPSALANIQAGRLTALAVTSATRVRDLPGVSTLAELGYPRASYVSFDGFMTSAKVPPERLTILRAAMAKALTDPQVRAALLKTGVDPAFLKAADYDEFLRVNSTLLVVVSVRADIKE